MHQNMEIDMVRPTRRTVTITLDLGDLGEHDVDCEVIYTPGARESGRFGLPEDYDPGCESEVDIIRAVISGTDWDVNKMLTDPDEIADRIANELDYDEEELAA